MDTLPPFSLLFLFKPRGSFQVTDHETAVFDPTSEVREDMVRNDRKLIFLLSDFFLKGNLPVIKTRRGSFCCHCLVSATTNPGLELEDADTRRGDVSDPNTSVLVGFFRAPSHEHMFKLGGKAEDLRNHLFSKAFGEHTKMIFGYCSPQVGMAGAARGPSGPSRKGRETGSLRAP